MTPTPTPRARPSADGAVDQGHSTWASVLVDVVAPVGIFYLLRALGVGQVAALLAGGAAPAARGIYVIARHRTVDSLAGLTLSVIVLTVATSLVTGDARFALARDAVITLAVGIWILVTLRTARPFIYTFCTTFMGPAEKQLWVECWGRSATFRHGMRVHTVIWGLGMIVDSAIRVAMAYTLPVDSVPALNAIQYAVLIGVLLLISVLYSRAAGLVPGSRDYPAKPAKDRS
ncbi:MAG: VC0807 family protein [Nocardioidaceae bacterium]|nr:VC0807 family protein [Nocardioidaceae bacterium]